MDSFKLLQSINYGTLAFAIFEKQVKENTFKNYSISKRIFNKATQQFDKVGNIQLESFNDLSLIKHGLKLAFKKDTDFMPYKFMQDENNFTLLKNYVDRDNQPQQQKLTLTLKETFSLIDLIDRILAINIKPNSLKEFKSNTREFIDTINSIDEEAAMANGMAIDDNIPF